MLKKLVYIILFCLIASKSYANMLFSKTYILLDSRRKSDILETTNLSTKKMRYRVHLVNYKQLPNGKYEVVKDNEGQNTAKNLFYVSPKSFILDNKETQTIRIMRKSLSNTNLKDLKDGEYRTHLVVREVEDLDPDFSAEEITEVAKKEETEGMTIEVKGFMGMSIPVIFRKGELTSSAKIAKATKIIKNNKDVLKLEVARNGNKSVRGNLAILANNKEVGKINNFAIYLENNRRFVEVPLDLTPLKGKEIKSMKISYKDSESKKKNVLSTLTLNNI